ncbi:hypothetical protein [Caulobacter vibrioides]|uniref:Uncharacterized protein n=1 Tax=Caulobacter vibrioides (strain NA1000 / CB15N) TaxID=565050 RepID=A0A0H3C9L9_CAUVN|nr:hypothetical protein [Caulobacter vibrioides]YP_002517382.1 hypothetical protein CCNA_02009 [Caulobacter vibrioides NA1000]ACL95474.1 hypothetical protein CCNA_02009 [Caulobacter vibrioides NA1000]ATC28804.1 hypothetical protein CA607_10575 [Caulobacter vibrioides]QXZ50317.1 hypothetical protein KZH45_10330 [Caulobacter vibrioides]
MGVERAICLQTLKAWANGLIVSASGGWACPNKRLAGRVFSGDRPCRSRSVASSPTMTDRPRGDPRGLSFARRAALLPPKARRHKVVVGVCNRRASGLGGRSVLPGLDQRSEPGRLYRVAKLSGEGLSQALLEFPEFPS